MAELLLDELFESPNEKLGRKLSVVRLSSFHSILKSPPVLLLRLVLLLARLLNDALDDMKFWELLLLDEPAAGMNPNETEELMQTIRFVRDHFDMTILLIEHDMRLVAGICEELSVLNFGEELAHGPTEQVLNDPKVITAYLGE